MLITPLRRQLLVALSLLGLLVTTPVRAAPPVDKQAAKAKAAQAMKPQVYRVDTVVRSTARKTVRLDSVPMRKAWQPGDPIRFIPKRVYPLPALGEPVNPTSWQVDPLLKIQADAEAAAAARGGGSFNTPSVNIAGQLFSGAFPPDTVGDVGPTRYVQAINANGGTGIQSWDKNGGPANGPFTLSSLGSGLCATGAGDPIILYDRLADRWFLSEFSGAGNALCVYISQTSDPDGTYFAYQFNTNNFPDYPKYGVWPDAYYVSTNEGGPSPVYAMDRTNMLAGTAATMQRFTAPSLAGFGFQALTPADLDGPTAPPAGTPGLYIRHRDDEVHNPGSNNPNNDFLEIWELDIDFAVPANSTFTGPTNITITEIESELCGLTSFMCFPQPNGQQLDPLREVVMFRLQYRNFGTHQSLVGNLTTDVNGADRGGIRWFELRNTGGGWSVNQEGTYSPDTDNRWMGSIAMDKDGNIALGYSVVSTTQSTDMRYVGRLSTDTAGTLPQGETTIGAGSGSQNAERWGDYSAMSVDPVDDCTFWHTNELVTSNDRWDTRIAAFKFPSCAPGQGAVCGDGMIEAPEQCDDSNANPGDGCSATCQVEPGFTCVGEPSVCTPDQQPGVCLDEDFDGPTDWVVFNTGAIDLNWGLSNDGFCFSENLGPPPAPNVTGGTGQAACIDSDASGGGVVEAYLCSPQFNTGNGTIELSLLFNYQFFDATAEDFFNLLIGTTAPGPATIGTYTELFSTSDNAGGFATLPGVSLSGPLAPNQDLHVCVGYGGDFDWYAQVDDVRVTASNGCGAPPVDTDGDGVTDDVDNCTTIPNPSQLDTNGDGFGNICDADLNGDCVVNTTDLGLLRLAFFSQGPNDADFNEDNVVNAGDLGIMRLRFFQPPGPNSTGTCP